MICELEHIHHLLTSRFLPLYVGLGVSSWNMRRSIWRIRRVLFLPILAFDKICILPKFWSQYACPDSVKSVALLFLAYLKYNIFQESVQGGEYPHRVKVEV